MKSGNRHPRRLVAVAAIVIVVVGCDGGGPPAEVSHRIEGQYPVLHEGDTHQVPFALTITNAEPAGHLDVASFIRVRLESPDDLTSTFSTATGQDLPQERYGRGVDLAPALTCNNDEHPTCTADLLLGIEAPERSINAGSWFLTAFLSADGAGNYLPDGADIQIHIPES